MLYVQTLDCEFYRYVQKHCHFTPSLTYSVIIVLDVFSESRNRTYSLHFVHQVYHLLRIN